MLPDHAYINFGLTPKYEGLTQGFGGGGGKIDNR